MFSSENTRASRFWGGMMAAVCLLMAGLGWVLTGWQEETMARVAGMILVAAALVWPHVHLYRLGRQLTDSRVQGQQRSRDLSRELANRQTVQQQLDYAQKLNQAIFDIAPIGIIIYQGISGQCILANQAAAAAVGGRVADLLQQNFRQIPSWQASGLLAQAENTLTHHQSRKSEILLQTSFGRYIWMAAITQTLVHEEQPYLLLLLEEITLRKETERDILHANAMLAAQQDTSPDGILLANPLGRLESWNRQFVKLWRIPPEVAASRNENHILRCMLDQVQNPEGFLNRMMALYENLAEVEEAIPIPLQDGRIFERYSRGVDDETGAYWGRVWFYRDVTAREQVTRTLAETGTILRATLESGRDGVLVVDHAGRVLEANAKFAELWRIPTSLLVSRDDQQLLAHVLDQLVDPQVFLKEVQRLYHTYEVATDTLHFKDGRVFERYSAPLIHDQHRIGRVWNFADVTDRWRSNQHLQQTARQLRQERALLRTIIDTIPDIIFIKDHEFRFINFNKAFEERTGFADNPMGKNAFDLFPEHEARAYLVSDQQVVANRIPCRFDEVVVRPDGEVSYYDTIKIPVVDGEGHTHGLVGICRDITERKKFEEDLRQAKEGADAASKAKSAFLATMSHEMRTPLNVLLGMLDMVVENNQNSELQNFLKTAHLAGESLLALINDILDLSKIEAGQLDLEHIPFHLPGLVKQVAAIGQPMARDQGIDLRVTMADHLPELVLGDVSRVRQILLNLVSNAIKFTHQGQVTVQVKAEEGDFLHFLVQDTGIGIAPDKLQVIFEPFTQADSTTTRRYGGTGMGLAICRHLCQLMGGRLWAESVPGQGSSFHCQLPLVPADRPVGEQTKTLPATPRATRPLTILMADDSEDNRTLIRAFLRKTAHRLVMAEDGQQAVALFREQPFDVVLMDLLMPVMDGYQATQAIRQWEEIRTPGHRTLVVALSAHTTREAGDLARAAGCDHYLTKPVRRQRLLDLLEQIAHPPLGEPTGSP